MGVVESTHQQQPGDISRRVQSTLTQNLSSRFFLRPTTQPPPVTRAGNARSSIIVRDQPHFVSDTNSTHTYPVSMAKNKFMAALHNSKLLCNISQELGEKLFAQAAVPVFVNKGDVLFEQDTDGHLLFVLIGGTFEQVFLNPATKQKKTKLVSNCAVAEMCVISMRAVHEFSLVCKDDTGFVLALHRAQFQMISVFFSERQVDHSVNTTATSNNHGFLSKIPLFAGMEPALLRELESMFVEQTFAFNERIMASKQPIPAFYIIVSGQVALRATSTAFTSPTVNATSSSSTGFAGGSFYSSTQQQQERRNLESKILFPESENNTIEWLYKGDYFGQQMLFSHPGRPAAQMGVNVLCSSKQGLRVYMLRAEDWFRFASQTPELSSVIREIHLARLMNSNAVFGTLTEDDLLKLAKAAEFKTYEDGEMIMEGGALAGKIYLLEQGAAKLFPHSNLQPTPSYFEFQNRAKNLIHKTSTRQGIPLLESATSMRTGTSTKMRSFLDLDPELFGGSSNDAAAAYNADLPSEATTSMDHGAMLASLGVSDYSSVVLLPGEVFGELNGRSHAKNKATVFAIGRVSVCVITYACLLAAIGKKELRALQPTNSGRNTQDEIYAKYMDYEQMQNREEQAQRLSFSSSAMRAGGGVKYTRKRLFQVHRLHETELVWVSVCMHQPSNMFTVVKELNVTRANKLGMGQYVLREQVMLAQVGQSDFISRMTASWEEPERLYLALELALCGDLRSLLFRTKDHPTGNGGKNPPRGELGGFDFAMMQWIAACSVLGLKHLYEHRVLHRDIKPNNIVVDHRGYCKLIDFGISKLLLNTSGSRTLTKVGSPKYMAPELVQITHFYRTGESYSNAVDWWSLGMTLYELAVGKLPYNLASHIDPYEKIHEYYEATIGMPRNTWFDVHPWFAPFRTPSSPRHSNNNGNAAKKWRVFGQFVAQLLDPNADLRLGGAATVRGPRGAMAHRVFADLKFSEIVDHTYARVPFHAGLQAGIVNMEDARREPSKFITLEQRRERAATQQTTSMRVKPQLMRASRSNPAVDQSVESKLRANLEDPELQSDKMNEVFEATDVEQKHAILAREQHIRKTAFKQGRNLNELQSGEDTPETRSLVLLQRASVIQTLQFFLTGIRGGNTQLKRTYCAIVIQAFWRGTRERMRIKKQRENAARMIQALWRGVLVQRAFREKPVI